MSTHIWEVQVGIAWSGPRGGDSLIPIGVNELDLLDDIGAYPYPLVCPKPNIPFRGSGIVNVISNLEGIG